MSALGKIKSFDCVMNSHCELIQVISRLLVEGKLFICETHIIYKPTDMRDCRSISIQDSIDEVILTVSSHC